MKTKPTFFPGVILALLFLGIAGARAEMPDGLEKSTNPNFRIIDDFEAGVTLWWLPGGSGSTTGIITEHQGTTVTYRAHETTIVNQATASTGAMKLAYMWDAAKPVAPGSHLIRQHIPPANADVVQHRFLPNQAIEVFVYGDGSGNRFRFMTREGGNNQLEGSQWFTIDWVGWKRITWRLSADPVVGWVNGNGLWDGTHIFFDSFQLAWSGQISGVTGTLYFDDFRIVDPFDVEFLVGSGGSPVVDATLSINGIDYPQGSYNLKLFPGQYQYFAKKTSFKTAFGNFEVNDANLSINVELTAGVNPTHLVTFTILDGEGELITDAIISIDEQPMPAGQYTFNGAPGFYRYRVSRPGFYPTSGIVSVSNANIFVNVSLIKDPSIFNNIYLKWDVATTATDPQMRSEHYSVWVAKVPSGNFVFKPEDFVKVFEETMGTTGEPWVNQSRSVEISEYRGSNIRIAFRHHNVSGMERLVIDNVIIEATRTGDSPAVVLSEDFSGGNVLPLNPDWLPEGWMAADADNDGRNWFFAVTNQQAHMISRSRLANNNPITPNNWLITKQVALPAVAFYNATFVVKDQDGANVAGATLTINGVEQDAGAYVFSGPNGTYQYTISHQGYQSATGQFTLAGADRTINVTINQIRFEVTFRVDIRFMPGFVPGGNTIYITGSFPGINWAQPGNLPALQLLAADPDNVFYFSKKLLLPAGTYQYKYFNGTSWNAVEWAGDPNRQVVVTGVMTVNDWYGHLSNPTSVPAVDQASFNLYPNPARSVLNIVANEIITGVRIIDMLGHLVYSEANEGNSHTVNVSGLKSGIYYVQIKTLTGIQTKRVQVVK